MKKISVALLSDFHEENWPSMDLVSNMLFSRISNLHSSRCTVCQVRPPMRRRFSALPLVGTCRPANNADRLINRFFDYPRMIRHQSDRFDVFHVIDHSYAQLIHELPAGRTVVTCHDLDTFRCLIQPWREPRSWQYRLMAKRILSGLAKASHVLCVSETIRQQFLKLELIPANRVSVIFNGVDQCFSISPDRAADAEAARLLPSTSLPCLLSVGSTIPRKRLDVVLRVFAAVRAIRPVHLIRVGGLFTPEQENLIAKLRIGDGITVLPFLETNVLAAVYRKASLAMITSDSEGFGLPLLEAMACGCPVLASDLPVLREIGSEATAFCPVGDVTSWAHAIIALLNERLFNPIMWERRRTTGSNWATKFNWETSAAQCVEIYKKLLERPRGKR